ncbi:vascular cell adhesion protein 1, partial [Elysia marginata]
LLADTVDNVVGIFNATAVLLDSSLIGLADLQRSTEDLPWSTGLFMTCFWRSREETASLLSAKPTCGLVEEGHSTALTCETTGCSASTLTWRTLESRSSVVVTCRSNGCGGLFDSYFPTTMSSTRSTLTISSVSRVTPFNMETKWSCSPCSRGYRTVCDKLQVYAKPQNPSCTLSENTGSGDITSVTVTCSTSKVYPQAKCSFFKETNGGNSVKVNNGPVYTHTPIPATATTPVYYRSQCSVNVSVQELGEGTHSFLGYIYPGVTRGKNLVNGSPADKDVTLSFPQVSQTCLTNMGQGYFIGKSARCTCRATSDGYPRGSAQWYKGDQTVGTNGDLDITYNKNNPEQVYTCEAKSTLGRKPGSLLRAKFAFIVPDSVQIASSSSKVNLCDNNNQVQMTCEISRDHVSPAPTFSFSVDGPRSQGPQPGTDSSDGNYYQSRFSLSPDVGGQYQVTCRVTNSVTNTWQIKSTQITFNKAPPGPPQVTVTGQTYRGISPSNIVTLAEGYIGDVTCRVEGGYPGAHSTQLKCGQLENTGDGNTATVRFTTVTLTRDLNGTVCTCTSQHDSGCYNNRETRYTLKILYAPEVTFTKSSPRTEFNKGDNFDFTCSAQGNPDPTSVILTRERNDDIIKSVQSAHLTHALDSLECLDTGVYICSGQNSQGTTSKEISISVNCTYMVPVERPDIVNTLRTTETSRPGHYEDIDGVHNTTHAPLVSTSSPPLLRQDQNITETSADTHTTLVSASQPPGNAQYETISDMVQQSGLYNSTSSQDVEPPNIYRRPKPETSSNTDHGVSGTYNNYAPGDHGETPDTGPRSKPTETTVTSLPAKNYVNVELTSVAGNTSNRKPHQQAYENVDMS